MLLLFVVIVAAVFCFVVLFDEEFIYKQARAILYCHIIIISS